jgi:spore coat protein CotH
MPKQLNMKNSLILILLFASLHLNAQSGRQLFDSKTVGEIRIKVDARNWSDQLDSMRIYGGGLMDASVIIDGKSYQGAGIRFRGDKSYTTGLKRNPFQIKLDYKNPGQQHQGYSTVKLSAAVRDPSMIREALFHEIAAKYMPGSKTGFTKLFVNDEYIGVFINVESIEKQMLERNFGTSAGSVFKAGVDNKPGNLPASCKLNIYGSLEYENNADCYKGNFEGSSGAYPPDFTRLEGG